MQTELLKAPVHGGLSCTMVLCPARGTENTGDGARGYTSPYFFCAASIRAFLTFSGILSPHVSLANV